MKTERLCLRQYKTTDARDLFLHFGKNPNMYTYSGWNPYATKEMAQNTIRHFIDNYEDNRFYGWAIEFNQKLIGTVGAYDYTPVSNSIEVGISIKEEFWGNGFATEALACVLHYLTNDEKIKSVTAWCASENIGSIKAMKKAGMKRVGVEKEALQVDGIICDKLLFCFSKE